MPSASIPPASACVNVDLLGLSNAREQLVSILTTCLPACLLGGREQSPQIALLAAIVRTKCCIDRIRTNRALQYYNNEWMDIGRLSLQRID